MCNLCFSIFVILLVTIAAAIYLVVFQMIDGLVPFMLRLVN